MSIPSSVVTLFEEALSHPSHSLYSTAIRNQLRRLFPHPLFLDQLHSADSAEIREEFERSLPLLKWTFSASTLSLLFLSSAKPQVAQVFQEMVEKWLMPTRRLDVPLFFSTEFKIPGCTQTYVIVEMVIRLKGDTDLQLLEHNLKIIQTEIRLGMVSVYHASRLLETSSMHSDGKRRAIQEKIGALIQRKPDQIDYDIFGEMQYFFVMSKEEFLAPRDETHLTRLLTLFYIFRKNISRKMEEEPSRRHICLKLGGVYLHLPWGLKRVLGICVSLNFLKNQERFEERHLIKAVQNVLKGIKPVEESLFISEAPQHALTTLYLEVENESGEEFSKEEILYLRRSLPFELKRAIEVALRPLFMPRNEEEVMRYIVTLSGQLRFVRDLPQMVLSFDLQKGSDLYFLVILVRTLLQKLPSIHEKFQEADSFLTFIPDRVRRVGMLRKKYPKEATVFRLRLSSDPYLRDDHSVDLLQARQEVASELQRVIGEVRDYNGGMIAGQVNAFSRLKKEMGELSREEGRLLETVFHSIFPVEMRTILPPAPLKKIFSMWKELRQLPLKKEVMEVGERALFYLSREGEMPALALGEDENLVLVRSEDEEDNFLGYIYFSD